MHGVQVRVARIFNTYGPRMLENDGRVVSNFIVQGRGISSPCMAKGRKTAFCYVDDLVQGFLKLMEGEHTGPMNLGNLVSSPFVNWLNWCVSVSIRIWILCLSPCPRTIPATPAGDCPCTAAIGLEPFGALRRRVGSNYR